MAEYDDSVSPVDEPEGRQRSVRRAQGPIGKAWAWFSAQPAQTKVIVLGVIVILGVIAWMAFRKTPAASTDSTAAADRNEIPTPPVAPPVPSGPPPMPAPPIPFGGGFLPGPQPGGGPAPVQPTQSGGGSGPGVPVRPAAPAVARWMITPGGLSDPYTNYNVNNAGHRQGIAITGRLS